MEADLPEAEAAAAEAPLKCPERPSELGLLVKNDAWWPLQRETIDMIVEAFVRDNKKYVMAGIPTGGGKTLIASAVQKLLAKHNLGRASLVLTHTIQLQDQYQRTLTDAAVVTGRSNWICDLKPDSVYRIGEDPANPLNAETAPCGQGNGCPEKLNNANGCGYYEQWFRAAAAPMVIGNYAFAMRALQAETPMGMSNPFRRDLLVADECHLAHNAIVEAAGTTLYMGVLKRYGLDHTLPGENTQVEVLEGGPRSQKLARYENVSVWIAWAARAYPAIDMRAARAKSDLRSAMLAADEARKAGRPSDKDSVRRLRSELRSLNTLNFALKLMAEVTNPHEWIVKRDRKYGGEVATITMQPLYAWSAAQTRLFNHFRRVLLMSATPGNPDIARTKLGIPKDDFVYIERPSTFPRENRPVLFWPVADLGYNSSDSDWERVAKAIGWIATRPDHVNRKGLIHSGSHANAKRLVALLNRYLPGRAFTHGSNAVERDAALYKFQSSADPLILVTASFTTGVDLPYIIGWQVIAKVPFGSLADDITRRRRAFKLDNGFPFGAACYTDDCANTVVQAAGRIVRSPDDSGPTFILDGNWKIVKQQAYLPKFFLDSYSKFTVE